MTTDTLPRRKDGSPATKTVGDAMNYWAERITNPTIADARPHERIQHRNGSIYADGDRLYHYGSHFEVARILRHTNGTARLVLLNGDSYGGAGGWGNSTSSVQRGARHFVSRTNVPGLVVPFSALDAAGITATTIMPLEVRDDRTEYYQRESTKRPGKHTMMDDPSGATYIHEDERHGYVKDGKLVPGGYQNGSGIGQWGTYTVPVVKPVRVENPHECEAPSEMHCYAPPAKLGEDGVWRWTISRHVLGDSLFRAKVTETRVRKATEIERDVLTAYTNWTAREKEINANLGHLRDERNAAEFGRSEYDRVTRQMKDREAPQPELIPALNGQLKAAREVWTDWQAQRPPLPTCDNRENVRYTVRRWATFLSSFDYGDPHRPYFMCEMPYGCKANTVEDAILALKPAEVEYAEMLGIEVLRQGDVFAIATDLPTKLLESVAKTWKRAHTVFQDDGSYERTEIVETIHKFRRDDKDCHVLGTSHAATHVIHTKSGDSYMRGSLYHAPGSWRTPDHRRVKLGDGKTWFKAVKNTVPLDKASGSSRGSISAMTSTANRSGDSRAWTITGAVD